MIVSGLFNNTFSITLVKEDRMEGWLFLGLFNYAFSVTVVKQRRVGGR